MKKIFKTMLIFLLYSLASIIGGLAAVGVGIFYIVAFPFNAIRYIRHPEKFTKYIQS